MHYSRVYITIAIAAAACASGAAALRSSSHSIQQKLYGAAYSTSTSFPLGQYQLSPITLPTLGLRHCDYVGYATPLEAGNDDFNWLAIAALNGQAGQVSFESVNFPGMYLAPIGPTAGVSEQTRVGPVTGPDANNASYTPVAGLSSPTAWSFLTSSATPGLAGMYIGLSPALTGACAGNYGAPSVDVFLASTATATPAALTWTGAFTPPPGPPSVVIDAANVTHKISKRFNGCHIDPGYENEPVGYRANLIYGEAFEGAPSTNGPSSWNSVASGGTAGSSASDPSTPFGAKGLPSMKVTITTPAGTGVVGASNRGLGNSGYFLSGGKDYVGFCFVKVPAGSGPVILVAQFNDYTGAGVLASVSQAVSPAADGSWVRVNFTLTPSASTTCVGVTSDPDVNCGKVDGLQPGHTCVKCGGEFILGLSGPAAASINLGYVDVSPGSWGTFQGQPVLKSAVDVLQTMGIQIIRQGGTVSQSFAWKDWRGPAWERPSLGHIWGASLVSGWGPFEFIAMCEGAGIEPVVTLAYDLNSVNDWADLVEYLYGNSSTTWGALRAADGHPTAYEAYVFELGNEQGNPDFVAQVTAMETRRVAVGAPEMKYMYPTNQGVSAAEAAALTAAGVAAEKIMPDIHIGGGGALPIAAADFAALPGFDQMAINVETNAGTHDLTRALSEAVDISDYYNALPPFIDRMYARAASFCTASSPNFDGFDQGISFFLPNGTWLQPPGYVHAMLKDTYAELGLSVVDNSTGVLGAPSAWGLGSHGGDKALRSGPRITVTSQLSEDGSTVYVRVANGAASPMPVTVNIVNAAFSSSVTQWVLTSPSASDANTPGAPTFVSPVQTTVQVTLPVTVTVPATSFTIWAFAVQ